MMSLKVIFVAQLVVFYFQNVAARLPLRPLRPNLFGHHHMLFGTHSGGTSQLTSGDNTLPFVAESLGETEVVTWAKHAGLAEALSGPGPMTFMAPTNTACDEVPAVLKGYLMSNRTALADVLKYHVIASDIPSSQIRNNQMIPSLNGKMIRMNVYKNGQVITASGAPVISPDHAASNGVLHEVSRVMLPPPGTVTFAVSKCPKFTTLWSLVTKAGLADKLNEDGVMTVFAPTNEAFEKLPVGVVDGLMNNPELLKEVLVNHIVPDAYYSAGLSSNDQLTTLGGKTLTVHMKNGDVYINDAKVVYPDPTVTNGVMHAINDLLIDPALHFELVPNKN